MSSSSSVRSGADIDDHGTPDFSVLSLPNQLGISNRPICCIVVEAFDEGVSLSPFASLPFNFAPQHLFFYSILSAYVSQELHLSFSYGLNQGSLVPRLFHYLCVGFLFCPRYFQHLSDEPHLCCFKLLLAICKKYLRSIQGWI